MSDKWKPWLWGAGGLVVVVLAVWLLFPGLLESFGALFFGQVSHCNEAPYAPDCFCDDGERKVFVPWLGVDRWHCETVADLILDPDDPDFEQNAIIFSQAYLSQECEICGDLSCGATEICVNRIGPEFEGQYVDDRCIDADYSWSNNGARLAMIRCLATDEWNADGSPSSGFVDWHMWFFVESPTGIPRTTELLTQNNFCLDTPRALKCAPEHYCNSLGNPDWCVPDLFMDVVPNDYPLSIVGLG